MPVTRKWTVFSSACLEFLVFLTDKLTRTGPFGPALRTVAPNHWSDFWSICCPDALLLPEYANKEINQTIEND